MSGVPTYTGSTATWKVLHGLGDTRPASREASRMGEGQRSGREDMHPTWGCLFAKGCHIPSGKGERRSPKPNTLKSVIFLS